ncbi:P-loop NTPase family protein [Brevinema andersonii]|uniref:hypothetical protein n=1 Tax=Brevinema andersonii TaxID=34097 RepID=UPI000B1E3D2F|nr:hypothetical protein [Brevinema andersonii]
MGIIISGPNAGGKIAVPQNVGTGSMYNEEKTAYPGKKIILPLFDKILLEIGDSQSLDDELSTFQAT